MASSYAYRSDHASVVCSTLLLADGRYCGNFMAVMTTSDGRREVHQRSCPGWNDTLADALICARALAESIYPPI
jgi:hypothetical protein